MFQGGGGGRRSAMNCSGMHSLIGEQKRRLFRGSHAKRHRISSSITQRDLDGRRGTITLDLSVHFGDGESIFDIDAIVEGGIIKAALGLEILQVCFQPETKRKRGDMR